MSSGTDRNFFNIALVVVAGGIVVTAVLYGLTHWMFDISRALHIADDAVRSQAVEERIRPIGRVALAGQEGTEPHSPVAAAPAAAEAAPAPVAEAEAAPATARPDGEAVYKAACTACHGAGIAGAPKTGDAAAWEARLEQGVDTLVRHAIEGFQGEAGFMPARGGHSNLSDEQVREAVQYMVDQLGG